MSQTSSTTHQVILILFENLLICLRNQFKKNHIESNLFRFEIIKWIYKSHTINYFEFFNLHDLSYHLCLCQALVIDILVADD
jgi:hypothetical protein